MQDLHGTQLASFFFLPSLWEIKCTVSTSREVCRKNLVLREQHQPGSKRDCLCAAGHCPIRIRLANSNLSTVRKQSFISLKMSNSFTGQRLLAEQARFKPETYSHMWWDHANRCVTALFFHNRAFSVICCSSKYRFRTSDKKISLISNDTAWLAFETAEKQGICARQLLSRHPGKCSGTRYGSYQ